MATYKVINSLIQHRLALSYFINVRYFVKLCGISIFGNKYIKPNAVHW